MHQVTAFIHCCLLAWAAGEITLVKLGDLCVFHSESECFASAASEGFDRHSGDESGDDSVACSSYAPDVVFDNLSIVSIVAYLSIP